MNRIDRVLPTIDSLLMHPEIADLDGETGSNRAPREWQQIDANNDFAAVQTWLSDYQPSSGTYRVYQKEVERLLLWCVFQHRKSLSSLTRDDMVAYINFLQNPQPRDLWCGKVGGRGSKRGTVNWKPFVGSLSDTSLNTALTIINTLLAYLVNAGYLRINPLALLKKRSQFYEQGKEAKKMHVHARTLTEEEWQAILHTLNEMPERSANEKLEKSRLKFIIAMLYFLGLRVGELTSHTWGAFQKTDNNWWFIVKGKGNKWGKIPVNDSLLHEISSFRAVLQMPLYPSPEEETPLVPSWRHANGLSARHINYLLKKLAARTANLQFAMNFEKQAKLSQFSAHWLRHLSASHQDRAGIPLTQIRANHRHEKFETTKLYVHADDKERVKWINCLSW